MVTVECRRRQTGNCHIRWSSFIVADVSHDVVNSLIGPTCPFLPPIPTVDYITTYTWSMCYSMYLWSPIFVTIRYSHNFLSHPLKMCHHDQIYIVKKGGI